MVPKAVLRQCAPSARRCRGHLPLPGRRHPQPGGLTPTGRQARPSRTPSSCGPGSIAKAWPAWVRPSSRARECGTALSRISVPPAFAARAAASSADSQNNPRRSPPHSARPRGCGRTRRPAGRHCGLGADHVELPGHSDQAAAGSGRLDCHLERVIHGAPSQHRRGMCPGDPRDDVVSTPGREGCPARQHRPDP